MRWIQTTVDKLEAFNVYQLGLQVYVIHRRPQKTSDGTIILHVLNLETGKGTTHRFDIPETVVEYVVHQS